jgi:hypothetical protein
MADIDVIADPRRLAAALALGRVVLGASLAAAPGLAPLPGDTGTGTLGFVVRLAGVRDFVLGVGALAALAEGRGARRWVAAGAAADLSDALMAVRFRSAIGGVPAGATAAIAGGAAAVGAYAAAGLTEPTTE